MHLRLTITLKMGRYLWWSVTVFCLHCYRFFTVCEEVCCHLPLSFNLNFTPALKLICSFAQYLIHFFCNL